ncbi:MAG TPA: D-glycero-beta-D-manno-heptose 1-phosphate adenylyltransferase [Candidatus Omnitrophota bacterium]|nr:D-glycero-beta-D-manno-heptose 1-phosphate adenylyltransferase [Candidatus Omnitrophota bacterium]HQJ15934.1 D-glycero-beta-D-manno-heptose 1-phosphate adenylyltransferase [Candidatus Omnitrophota bacterium]
MRSRRRLFCFKSKIKSASSLVRIVRSLRRRGRRVVFTNGCFDILHAGHVSYLESARNKGDVLVVGINSDSSVRRLKGRRRPVVSQARRAEVVAALESVDYVVIFPEDTPERLILALRPDVLVKGGDWKIKDIVGSRFVLENGGHVCSIKFVKGLSTTSLIRKISHALS